MFDVNYEEYRDKLLSSQSFKEELAKEYNDTIYSIQSYVDSKSSLSLAGLLGFGAGFLMACFLILDGNSGWLIVLIKSFLFIGFVVCSLFSLLAYRRFKEKLSTNIYYSYVEEKLIADRVYRDQFHGIAAIRQELRGNCIDLDWGIDALKSRKDPADVVSLFERVSCKISSHEQKLSQIDTQSHYPQQLSNDYQFTKTIYEYIHK